MFLVGIVLSNRNELICMEFEFTIYRQEVNFMHVMCPLTSKRKFLRNNFSFEFQSLALQSG